MQKHGSNFLEKPFFVVGPLRSGTTLLRLLLDHNPDLNCFGEFETAVSQAVGKDWPDMERFHTFLEIDRQSLAHNFTVDRSLAYEPLIYSFLAQKYQLDPEKLVGASVHSRIDLLPKLWPKAKFIHLNRDPRDVARSCIGMGWVGNVYDGAVYWKKAEQDWEKAKLSVPDSNALEVYYEALVAEPEMELARICSFLGVDYTPKMLELHTDTTYSKPDARFANQWKKKLSAEECRWVEYRCADLMKVRGYDLVSSAKPPARLLALILKIQTRLYRLYFNSKRYGIPLYCKFLVAKRLRLLKILKSTQLEMNRIVVQKIR